MLKVEVDLVVTRHRALAEYLREIGVAVEGAPCPWGCIPAGTATGCPACAGTGVYSTPVLTHVQDPCVLDGKRVAGAVPLELAARCAVVVTVPLRHTPETRGRELSLDEMRELALPPVEYVCRTAQAYAVALRDAANDGFREGAVLAESR